MPRFLSHSAVYPIILREGAQGTEILLHRRRNTGWMDGRWDTAGSGHVDAGETASEACVRECAEELGIGVLPEHVAFAHLTHRLIAAGAYYDLYFRVLAWEGEPSICEPEKSSALAWFPLDALPEDLIDDRRRGIRQALAGAFYSEVHAS